MRAIRTFLTERHRITGTIRNKNTRRVLKPNRQGQVRLRNGSISKWVIQSKEECMSLYEALNMLKDAYSWDNEKLEPGST